MFKYPPLRDLQTWFIRGRSAGSALDQLPQPGVYAYGHHNLIEAVNLGVSAYVVAKGEWGNALMEQVMATTHILS